MSTLDESQRKAARVKTPEGSQTKSVVDGENHVTVLFEATSTGNFLFQVTGDNNWSFYSVEVTTVQ